MNVAKSALHVLIILLYLLVSNQTTIAQSNSFDLNQIMTNEDQRKTGISKLSNSEREALEIWLYDFALDVIEIYQKRETNDSTNPSRTSNAYYDTGSGHWISENIERGRYIKLEDDSLWEIMGIDRVYTSLWLVITEITVLEAPTPVGEYKYLLINTDDGEQAYAKLVSN